jgi:hypothetical protein
MSAMGGKLTSENAVRSFNEASDRFIEMRRTVSLRNLRAEFGGLHE